MNKSFPLVISLDMDGTLLDDQKNICPKTEQLLKQLVKKGHYIVLTSGRPPRTLFDHYNQLQLNTPLICYNGNYVIHPNDHIFPEILNVFNKNNLGNMYEELKSKKLAQGYTSETNSHICYDVFDPFLDKFFSSNNMISKEGNVSDCVLEDPFTFIVKTFGEYERREEIVSILKKYGYEPRFWTTTTYLELYRHEISKGSAILHVAKYYDIPRENIIAFGDADNDIELLSEAGVSVAMKNANDKLKNIATMVSLEDNNNDGIYYTLLQILDKYLSWVYLISFVLYPAN